MDELQLGYVFGQGVCQNKNVIRVISHFDEFDNYGSNSSSLMMWSRTKNQWHHYTLGWRAIRMGCGKSGMYALGTGGEILQAGPSGVVDEFVTDKPGGEAAKGLNDISLLGEQLYVVGSGGQVFKGEGQGVWTDIAQSLEARDEITFNGISGLDESDFYAVGDNGVIERCVKGQWKTIACRSDLNLHRVKVVAPATAYATGRDGVIVRIEGDSAEVVVSDESFKGLCGIASFNDKLFFATDKEVLTLGKGLKLEKVDVVVGTTWTFGNLDTNDGVLWSFGKNHLFWTEDGEHWHNGTPRATHFDPAESGPSPSHSGSSCCTGGAHKCD